jgi:prepilin-type N-terminal cleavage/methylation domain-containing protein
MRGYSLIELLIVVGLIGLISGVVVTAYKSTLNVQSPRSAALALYVSLADASLRARSMQQDSAWGVEVLTDKVVTFKGTVYATRDTTQDRTLLLPSQITITGVTDTVFSKFTGLPSSIGTTTFKTTFASSSVYLLSSGMVTYTP